MTESKPDAKLIASFEFWRDVEFRVNVFDDQTFEIIKNGVLYKQGKWDLNPRGTYEK